MRDGWCQVVCDTIPTYRMGSTEVRSTSYRLDRMDDTWITVYCIVHPRTVTLMDMPTCLHDMVHAEASDQCQTYLGTPSFLAITRRVAHLILQCNHTIAYMQVRFAFRFPTPAMSTTLDHTP